jgi:hypothetical protein
MTGMARLGGAACRVGLGLILAVSFGTAFGVLVGRPAFASGETGGSPTEPTGTGTSNCPSSNPPNQMTLVAGTPQTTMLGSAFASALQVALSNSDGCPVTSAAAGTPVTFSAPAGGASGVFSASGSDTVIVGADASGDVAAPLLSANDIQGSYTVVASSQYGSVSFSMTNTAAGIPARILAIAVRASSASVMSRFPEPLQVRVLDSAGNPVAGTTVTFTLGSGASSACGTTSSASASFTGGAGTQATAMTDANGVASSPAFTANSAAGSFTAIAAVAGKEPTGGSSKENSGGSDGGAVTPVSFSLSNLAGKPATLTTGVGSRQSTPAGSAFPIRLAVTVADAEKNPVRGAEIMFSAPLRGASGHFTVYSRALHRSRAHVSRLYAVQVKTNACGIAVAPAFTASHLPGGYIVQASVKHTRPAAFALVNVAPGQSE